MKLLKNARNAVILSSSPSLFPTNSAARVRELLARCPAHEPTPLLDRADIARDLGVSRVSIKDERARMDLGSFKALGAAFAIALAAEDGKAKGQVFVTASAGNHGLSVAAGAKIFGAQAVIYLSETVPAGFADRLRAWNAEVVVEGADYEASMTAAATAAEVNGWTLLSDSSWEGYTTLPHQVMEGYGALSEEVIEELEEPPTHIFLQAGVGGMAASVAAIARRAWGDAPCIIVVEPEAAPCLMESVAAGALTATTGPVSSMGRLDCKEASMIALNGLNRDADAFVTIDEDEAAAGIAWLDDHMLPTSPSGGAGLGAARVLSAKDRNQLGIDNDSRLLFILSEGPA